MKILILGIAIFMTGFIGFSILCGAAVASNFTVNGSTYYVDIWRLFGVNKIAAVFIMFGIIGIILSMIGVFSKSK